VPAEVREGLTGVWTGDRKIASIGVHVSRGVTTHGFAINVENDLQPFSWVVPCGLDGVNMTSVSRELRRGSNPAHPMTCFRRQAAHAFCQAFGRRQRLVAPARLGLIDAPLAPARTPDREPAPA
jgi:lipoyl(octanoyl) transferase